GPGNGGLHLALGLSERLAHLQRDLAGDLVGRAQELIAEALAEREPLLQRGLRPFLLRAAGGVDHRPGAAGVEQRHFCDRLTGERVVDQERGGGHQELSSALLTRRSAPGGALLYRER